MEYYPNRDMEASRNYFIVCTRKSVFIKLSFLYLYHITIDYVLIPISFIRFVFVFIVSKTGIYPLHTLELSATILRTIRSGQQIYNSLIVSSIISFFQQNCQALLLNILLKQKHRKLFVFESLSCNGNCVHVLFSILLIKKRFCAITFFDNFNNEKFLNVLLSPYTEISHALFLTLLIQRK